MATEADDTATEAVDYGQAEQPQGEPSFIHNTTTDTVSVDWHGDRPDQVIVATDLLEDMINTRNALTHRVSRLEGMLIAIRYGRRPSKQQWLDAQLPKLSQEARMDLMRRKRSPS